MFEHNIYVNPMTTDYNSCTTTNLVLATINTPSHMDCCKHILTHLSASTLALTNVLCVLIAYHLSSILLTTYNVRKTIYIINDVERCHDVVVHYESIKSPSVLYRWKGRLYSVGREGEIGVWEMEEKLQNS